jgi:hypothetical protein
METFRKVLREPSSGKIVDLEGKKMETFRKVLREPSSGKIIDSEGKRFLGKREKMAFVDYYFFLIFSGEKVKKTGKAEKEQEKISRIIVNLVGWLPGRHKTLKGRKTEFLQF